MSCEAIRGAIVNISLLRGIPILRSQNLLGRMKLMYMASKQKIISLNKGIARHGRRPKHKEKIKLYILQGLAGVGAQKALALLHHFGSVEKIMNAGVKELKQVSGIGLKTARLIRALLS